MMTVMLANIHVTIRCCTKTAKDIVNIFYHLVYSLIVVFSEATADKEHDMFPKTGF